VIVEAPVNGIDAPHVRYNAWQFRQILGRGVHGILWVRRNADAGRAFRESCRYSEQHDGRRPAIHSPRHAGKERYERMMAGTDSAGRKLWRRTEN